MTDKPFRIHIRGRWFRRKIWQWQNRLTDRQRRRILLWCLAAFILFGCLTLVRGCGQITIQHIEPITLKP